MAKPSIKYDINPADINPARRRLLERHYDLGSWHRVAAEIGINVRYVYNFGVKNKLPSNPRIRKILIGRRTINDHLANDRIQDMPRPLLRYALLNRVDMISEDMTNADNTITMA